MKKYTWLTFLPILLFLLPSPATLQTLRVATWNIEHLRDENDEGPNARDPADYTRLAVYASRLNADIVALQEVEGPAAAERVFDPEKYSFYFSSRDDEMLTGFAVRKTISVTQNPDYEDLDVSGRLRYGTDITVTTEGQQIRFLSVHLKSGCHGGSLDSDTKACRDLREQLPVLERWIDARAAENTPFVVLGDFNRRFDNPCDTFWPEIDDGEPANADLTRVPEGLISECWCSEYPLYIDYIILDRRASKWVVTGSFEQWVYDEDESVKKKLSDHCPISVLLDLSQSAPKPDLNDILHKIDSIEVQIEELRQWIIDRN